MSFFLKKNIPENSPFALKQEKLLPSPPSGPSESSFVTSGQQQFVTSGQQYEQQSVKSGPQSVKSGPQSVKSGQQYGPLSSSAMKLSTNLPPRPPQNILSKTRAAISEFSSNIVELIQNATDQNKFVGDNPIQELPTEYAVVRSGYNSSLLYDELDKKLKTMVKTNRNLTDQPIADYIKVDDWLTGLKNLTPSIAFLVNSKKGEYSKDLGSLFPQIMGYRIFTISNSYAGFSITTENGEQIADTLDMEFYKIEKYFQGTKIGATLLDATIKFKIHEILDEHLGIARKLTRRSIYEIFLKEFGITNFTLIEDPEIEEDADDNQIIDDYTKTPVIEIQDGYDVVIYQLNPNVGAETVFTGIANNITTVKGALGTTTALGSISDFLAPKPKAKDFQKSLVKNESKAALKEAPIFTSEMEQNQKNADSLFKRIIVALTRRNFFTGFKGGSNIKTKIKTKNNKTKKNNKQQIYKK